MKRREFIALVGGAAASVPFAARGQQKLPVIGVLVSGAAGTTAPLLAALSQGLRENGMIEAKDYILEPRFAEGQYQRFPGFADELVSRRASVIMATTIAAARAAQRASSVIPIVMTGLNDPVGNGIIASLARPGGNTTGMATLNQDVTPKLVEFVHAVVPNAATAALLFNPANPSNGVFLKSVGERTAPLGIAVKDFAVSTPDELDATFGKVAALRPDVLLVMPDAAMLDLAARIGALALQNRIPVISTDWDLTVAGGLISYGLSRRENYRRSAYFVKKVLEGVKPADLPVEQPTRILLTINLKTAKALGLTVPPTLLATADEVIE